MNKEARFIDFQNARNFFYQNPRTFNERTSTQIINVYYSSSTSSINNIIIDLKDAINIDCMSEIRLESIQVTTMNQSTIDDTGTNGQDRGAFIPINTIGYIIDIEEFETKAASNIDAIRDKIFIPYTNYNINNVSETDTANLGSGFSYYNNSGPLKNNYISTINSKKLKTLNLTIKRLASASKKNSVNFDNNLSNQPVAEDIFLNEDYFGGDTQSDSMGGDIMLVFSITNLPSMMVNKDSVENIFMNPQDDLMNVQSEYDIMLQQKRILENNINRNNNNRNNNNRNNNNRNNNNRNNNNDRNQQFLSNQQRMNNYQQKFRD